MSDEVNPTWSRWGTELRRQRERCGMTQAELAKAIRYSAPLVSGFERGTRYPKRDHIDALEKALSTGGALLQLWTELSDVREIPVSWRSFLTLEREAEEIRDYQSLLIPGLLQAPVYARTILRQSGTRPNEAEVDELLKTRLERMSKLLPNVRLWFVVEETVVRKVVGSPDTQRKAIDHLLQMAQLEHVRLTVVPEHAPRRPGLSGTFRVMRLPDGRSVAHAEHILGEAVINEPSNINHLMTFFGDLQTESLNPSASIDLIEKIKGSLG